MSALKPKLAERSAPSNPSCRDTAAHALTIVRDGVITGEGPTTKGRVHFSRALDADDAAWCVRILTAARSSISRSAGPKPRRCSRSMMPRPSAATMAVSTICWPRRSSTTRPPRRACRCRRAPSRCRRTPRSRAGRRRTPSRVNTEVLEWIASQMRGKQRSNRTLVAMVATLARRRRAAAGAQLPNVFDIGM